MNLYPITPEDLEAAGIQIPAEYFQ